MQTSDPSIFAIGECAQFGDQTYGTTPAAEAQARAICMATNDFHRAYHAFVAKQTPVFEGD